MSGRPEGLFFTIHSDDEDDDGSSSDSDELSLQKSSTSAALAPSSAKSTVSNPLASQKKRKRPKGTPTASLSPDDDDESKDDLSFSSGFTFDSGDVDDDDDDEDISAAPPASAGDASAPHVSYKDSDEPLELFRRLEGRTIDGEYNFGFLDDSTSDDEGDRFPVRPPTEGSDESADGADRFRQFKKVVHPNRPTQRDGGDDSDSDEDDYDHSYFHELDANAASDGAIPASFSGLHLSPALLRALTHIMKFRSPTPIQSRAIPPLLQGLDLCASAETGSGKTAAFLLPSLERLLHRDRLATPAIRVLVVLPTRELAQQCYAVCQQLSRFTDIRCCLAIGGPPSKPQARELKKAPDVVIGTPGRLIAHHMTHVGASMLSSVEILILDEADRLLEMGFRDELQVIVDACSADGRQSMLFSATMTDNVKQLSRLSLRRPVRIRCNPRIDVPKSLVQQFVRIRSTGAASAKKASEVSAAASERKEKQQREAVLLALVMRDFHKRVIIFVNRRVDARRLKIILMLFGRRLSPPLRVSELHGELTHEQRMAELERFRLGSTAVLVATDVGARGLDIPGVETVINFFMPTNPTNYIHRVGRTARIGHGGVAVSLIDETSRPVLRQVVKRARKRGETILHRVLDASAVGWFRRRLGRGKKAINDLFRQGVLDRVTRQAEKKLAQAEEAMRSEEGLEEVAIQQRGEQQRWFRSKQDAQLMRRKEKEQLGVSKSGRKRVRGLLEKHGIGGSGRRKRRRLDGGGRAARVGGEPEEAELREERQREKEATQMQRAAKRQTRQKKKKPQHDGGNGGQKKKGAAEPPPPSVKKGRRRGRRSNLGEDEAIDAML